MYRKGSLDLPLHHGTVPAWLADRMMRLGRAIVEIILLNEGTPGFLKRLSDPLWFQCLGASLGMDWHSSGMTTSVMRALQRGLNPRSEELGLVVLGGRGKYSRNTPGELEEAAPRWGLDPVSLVRTSRLTAKIDNTCIQDGFQLYLHNFVLTREGHWAVVQQGMDQSTAYARRYHWLSGSFEGWFDDPHSGVEGENRGVILNLSDKQAGSARNNILDFLSLHPDRQQKIFSELLSVPKLHRGHEVRPADVNPRRLGAVLTLAYEQEFRDFTQALLLPGVGPRTIQSLGLVSEVIYGSPVRFHDPARFSFAHGGKDGHPHPVRREVYDQTIDYLDRAIREAKIDLSDKKDATARLYRLQRWIESRRDPHVDVEKLIEKERGDYQASPNPPFHIPGKSFKKAIDGGTLDLPFV